MLPDTRALNGYQTNINPTLVAGEACSGKVGDPWWATDCSCACNQLLTLPDGSVAPCQQVKPITRHDIYVGSTEECLADFTNHVDPFL